MPRSITVSVLKDLAQKLLIAALLALAAWFYHAEQRLTRLEKDQEAMEKRVTELTTALKEQRTEISLSLQKLHSDLFALAMGRRK